MKFALATLVAIAFLILALLTGPAPLAETKGESSASLVVHLLDYLAKDYGGAVQNGKVISQSEFDEQVEFAAIVEKTSRTIPALGQDPAFVANVDKLGQAIRAKGPVEEVARTARSLQREAIRLAKIEIAPTSWPSLASGAKLYQANCVSCHGGEGKGDGPAGKALDPKPADFHDKELVKTSSPFKFFNTIRLGVPGTGMTAFPGLSDKEVWDLAFYLKSLPHARPVAKPEIARSIGVKEAASMSDEELAEKFSGDQADLPSFVASVRTRDDDPSKRDPLDVADELLNESLKAAQAGERAQASQLALRAYLEGVEPMEPKLKANLPGAVEKLESLMARYRESVAKKEPLEKTVGYKTEISAQLDEARKVLSSSTMSPAVAFGAAFSIFLREGFEAILIIVVLISVLRAMNQAHAVKWVHFGWVSAVVVGVALWLASGLLLAMSGLSRELLEGAISLLAVAVLVYVGFWLHRFSEARKWQAFLKSKLKEGLSTGSYVVLSLVAFMAVFREAIEVVLFLRAIWIDLDPAGQRVAGLGVLSSIVLLAGFAYLAIVQSRKLPVTFLFKVCSWTMIALALILAGKGAHSLQEAGFFGVSSLPFQLRIDLLGLYPTVETVAAQAIVAALFGALFFTDARTSQSAVAASVKP